MGPNVPEQPQQLVCACASEVLRYRASTRSIQGARFKVMSGHLSTGGAPPLSPTDAVDSTGTRVPCSRVKPMIWSLPPNRGETSMKKHKLLIAMIMFGLTWTGIVRAEDQPIEQQLVDAMNKVFGVHPGFRANHAKGIVVEGRFKASPESAGLSRAVLFNGSSIAATVRFSDSTGIPNIPDGSADANPHGMAIKFHLPDGSETDMVINSLKFFPVATGEDFRDLLLALAASPPDASKPTKFEQFAASHPSVPAAFATVGTPDSFA